MLWLPSSTARNVARIRRAQPDDAAAIARVYVDSWREAYAGLVPQSYLDSLSYSAFERHWRRTFAGRGWAFVAELENEVVGLASGGRCRRQNIAAGEIYVLYVLKVHHRKGIGRALFDACHLELARRGYGDTLVWVLSANPARRFYERLGGQFVSENDVTIGGTKLREVAYIWRD